MTSEWPRSVNPVGNARISTSSSAQLDGGSSRQAGAYAASRIFWWTLPPKKTLSRNCLTALRSSSLRTLISLAETSLTSTRPSPGCHL